jgi:hypothetical protein
LPLAFDDGLLGLADERDIGTGCQSAVDDVGQPRIRASDGGLSERGVTRMDSPSPVMVLGIRCRNRPCADNARGGVMGAELIPSG